MLSEQDKSSQTVFGCVNHYVTMFDLLRLQRYTSACVADKLPPTSSCIRGHIQQAADVVLADSYQFQIEVITLNLLSMDGIARNYDSLKISQATAALCASYVDVVQCVIPISVNVSQTE